MAECWAGGMELGGGFSLRSFVKPPPLRFRFSHPYPSLAEPASCAWVLGELRWGGGVHFSYCGELQLIVPVACTARTKSQAGL